MGIHVGLGLEYYLNEVSPYLNKGDIVILAPEYYHVYHITESGFNPAFYMTMELYPTAIKFIEPKRRARSMALSFAELMQNKLKSLVFRKGELENDHIRRNKLIYLRDSYDENGDMVAHIGLPSQHTLTSGGDFKNLESIPVKAEFVSLTNQFAEKLEDMGISFYFSYPPTPTSYYDEHVAKIMSKELHDKLTYPIIGTAQEMKFEDDQFFDTRYHLTSPAREIRSTYLSIEIKKIIESQR
jgi:hypothetical protein